jgi:uncharacterized FAD-dependent dehydrogenase
LEGGTLQNPNIFNYPWFTYSMQVAIIGAGPAGLFAALELAPHAGVTIVEEGLEPLKRECPVSSQSDCINCTPCHITSGVGGAGALSDGKLNLTYKIGGDPESLHRKPEEIQELIDYIDQTFVKFGADTKIFGDNDRDLELLKRKASSNGIEFISGKQRHMGSDQTKKIVSRFYQHLNNKGVQFELRTKVNDIKKDDTFVLKTTQGDIHCDYLLAAPGRAGAYWLRTKANKLGATSKYGPIDVGLRVEFPAEIYEPIADIMYDAKFRLYTETYDDLVRTFCTNPHGFVTLEKYESILLVNGDARKNVRSNNTNLALLSRVELTDPVEDTTEYGRSIAQLANTIGGGKPILQRYKDLIRGKRSTWSRISRALISPTLRDVTPGDVAMALPNRIVKNMIEAIERLDAVIEGIASGSTLLYAPEIKFYDTTYQVNRDLETQVPGFFVAGDASGFSRGIIYAAVTGIIAARGIIKAL